MESKCIQIVVGYLTVRTIDLSFLWPTGILHEERVRPKDFPTFCPALLLTKDKSQRQTGIHPDKIICWVIVRTHCTGKQNHSFGEHHFPV